MIAIGLGSNLNHPQQQIKTAMETFANLPDIAVTKQSRLYQSKPMGTQDQPDFVNAVIIIATTLTPKALLTVCQNIEQQQGRERLRHWGERTIDCDILLYHDQVINTPTLTLPHPGITQRAFVLIPLLEIAPDSHGPDGIHYADALASLPLNDYPTAIKS